MRYRKSFDVVVILIVCSIFVSNLEAQCINDAQFPNFIFNTPNYSNDTVTISNGQYAGEYAVVSGMASGETYRFIVASDLFISITDKEDNILSSGLSPLEYTPSVPTIKVHVNLVFPPCGTNTIGHTLSIYCVTCPEATTILMGPEVVSDYSAVVNMGAAQQGILIPRYGTADKLDIPDPANGLLVYDLNLRTISAYNGSSGEWENMQKSILQTRKIVIPAESFHPYEQTNGNANLDVYTSSVFGRYGNFNSTVDAAVFTARLELPIGSVITNVKYYYYDNNTTLNVNFEILRRSLTSTSTNTFSSFTSSGSSSSKRNSSVSSNLNISENFSYSIRAYRGSVNSPTYSSMGILGVEVEYTEPN